MAYTSRPFSIIDITQKNNKLFFTVVVNTSLGPLWSFGWRYSLDPKSKRRLYAPAVRFAGFKQKTLIRLTPHMSSILRKLCERAVADLETKKEK